MRTAAVKTTSAVRWVPERSRQSSNEVQVSQAGTEPFALSGSDLYMARGQRLVCCGAAACVGSRAHNPQLSAFPDYAMPKISKLGVVSASIGLLFAAMTLGSCSRSYGPPAPVAAAVPRGPVQPNWPSLPEKAACTNDLNRYQNVLWGDVTTGNLNQSVYELIEADLSRAANACAEGNDSEARAIIRSTKLKHGYRAYL